MCRHIPFPRRHLLPRQGLRYGHTVLRGPGNVADADVEGFSAAGFAKQQVFDVILGMAHKVMSDYTNPIAGTPVVCMDQESTRRRGRLIGAEAGQLPILAMRPICEGSNMPKNPNVVVDIYSSFRALPGWVQIWVVGILMPINTVSLFFLGQPWGVLVAILAIGGMLPNLPIMLRERGLSKAMSLPHLLPWTVLVLLIVFVQPQGDPLYRSYLMALAAINTVSLGFDYVDAYKWWKGERDIAQ